MRNGIISLVVLVLFAVPLHAQDAYFFGGTPISRENINQLVVLGDLQLPPVESNSGNFEQNEVEWSYDGNWLGMSYGYMAYIYNINLLGNNPFAFDMRYQRDGGCGTPVDYYAVRDIALHPHGDYVAITTEEELHIYDLITGEQVAIRTYIYVSDIEFLLDGRLIVSASGDSFIWQPGVSEVSSEPVPSYHVLQLNTDALLYGTNTTEGAITALSGTEPVRTYEPPVCEINPAGGLCGLPPDKDLLTVSQQALATVNNQRCFERQTNVWNTRTGEVIQEFPFVPEFMALSYFGQMIAFNTQDGSSSIGFYDISTGDMVYRLQDTENTVDVQFSPSGNLMATINTDGRVRLWTIPENLPSRQSLLSLSSVVVDAYCDSRQFVPVGVTVSIGWSWFAKTSDQLYNHLRVAEYKVSVNDSRPNRWILVSRPEDYAPHGENVLTVFYYMPVGTEVAGEHIAAYSVTWREQIYDGFRYYGGDDGTPMVGGTCRYQVG